MRIVIVGAGVAGCVMARKLSRLEGVEVTCLERVQRDDHSEAGTGLNVGPNAVKALTSVDPAGWKREADDVAGYYSKFDGKLPEALRKQLLELHQRLE